MIPKSGNRFSEKIMLQQICRAGKSFEESYPALWARTKQQGRCNQRCQPGEQSEHERPCGTPAPASPVRARFLAEIAHDRQGAVRKGAFALDDPLRDILGDRLDHVVDLGGLREYLAPVPRILEQPIHSLVTAHIDVRY